jgi:hypothetical protein
MIFTSRPREGKEHSKASGQVCGNYQCFISQGICNPMATVFVGTASQVIPSGGSRKDLREPPRSKNFGAPHSSGWIFLAYIVKKIPRKW